MDRADREFFEMFVFIPLWLALCAVLTIGVIRLGVTVLDTDAPECAEVPHDQ